MALLLPPYDWQRVGDCIVTPQHIIITLRRADMATRPYDSQCWLLSLSYVVGRHVIRRLSVGLTTLR